ncbi:MAG: NAD-dependent epimerase/dehydratase family protein [Acidimicrobiia bacterium]
MRRILVTGAATWTGCHLIERLERIPDVAVIAVDEIPAPVPLNTEVRIFELDNAEFAHFVIDAAPDALVHLQTVDRSAMLGGRRAHDEAVVGSQALFGAIRRCRSIKQVVVKSDLCIYGMGPRCPSVVTEDTAFAGKRGRYGRDLEQVEGYTADAAAVRGDAVFTILRFAPIFGVDVDNPVSRYLRLPVVPTRLGYDPRLQLLSGHDAVRAIEHAIDHPEPGAFNIAAPGQLYLSRILRLGRRAPQPLPSRAYDIAIKGMRRANIYLPEHIKHLVQYGLVADTTRMTEVLGFQPNDAIRVAITNGFRRSLAPSGLR